MFFKRRTIPYKEPLSLLLTALLFLGVAHSVLGQKGEPQRVLAWGKRGDREGEFYSPIGIAINKKDEIFVTDLNNARVQKFTTEGRYLGGFDLPWDTPPRKSSLVGGIVLDNKGQIFLSFMVQHKIAVYTEAGKLVREWGKKGNGDGEFNQPGGMIFDRDGFLYVADQCNHRIQKFTSEGLFVGKWGEYGDKPGQFGSPDPAGSRFGGPHFLTLDKKQRLYTTEGTQGRVQQLSLEGKPFAVWGDKGDQQGGFGGMRFGGTKNTFGPIAVFVDRRDRVWVSSLNNRVQAFTPEGKFLFGIGLDRDGKPTGVLSHPHGMAMDSKGYLYVCDSGNQQIQKFKIP
jgi:sugar lactone lactonase YvrE